MSWKDVQARIRGFFTGQGEGASRRPDGGTSCYRPVQRRNRQEENQAREKAMEYAAGQPPVAYAHTGFTGMNPPMTGSQPVQSTFQGAPYGYGAAQAAQQQPQGAFWPQGGERGTGYMPQEQGSFADNISYMPGAYMPDAGSSYTHVEHIMAITSLRSCYEAIECMKNGETLIVTLDVLGNEGESLRCQDMLAGAAFTLQCSVRTLPSVGVVVIVPSGVKILPEQKARTYDQQGSFGAYSAPQAEARAEYTPRRERRVSQNPVGWDRAAQAGAQGINPYTGSMPAAAGEYSAYGGY